MKQNEEKELIQEEVTLHHIAEPKRESHHEWRQKGINIECTSCEIIHGVRVAPNQKMIGIENGMPILKSF